MGTPYVIDKARLIVGECPLWDERKGLLYTIDIRGKCIRCWDPKSQAHTQVDCPQEIGSIALMEDGRILAALTDGIYIIGTGGSLTPLCIPETLKGRRFNDGKVGPDKRFYVGTTDNTHKGAFYCLDQEGTWTELFEGVGCSNGLAWSSDHKTLYYCDSPKRVLEAFDFNVQKGTLKNRRVVMPLPCEEGLFDGMTIDTQDKLWVAVWGSNRIFRLDPTKAQVLESIHFPVSRVSCCGFAGDDLRTLAITTAAYQAKDESAAGYTYALSVQTPGLPTWRYERNADAARN